jgi:hypothetical protein
MRTMGETTRQPRVASSFRWMRPRYPLNQESSSSRSSRGSEPIRRPSVPRSESTSDRFESCSARIFSSIVSRAIRR